MVRHHNGFALTELLIVLAVLGILASVLLPRLMHSREIARERAAIVHAKNVFTASFAYVAESPENQVVTGDCTTGYTAGDYTLGDPGNSTVQSCMVSDADSNGIPEVEVTTSTGMTVQYP